MDKNTTTRMEARAIVIKALAHPSRLVILETLADGERCVQSLQQIVGTDISTISKHLNQLRTAGIVTSEKRGLKVYYRLKTDCLLKFFRCIDDLIEDNIKEQTKLIK